MPGQPVTIAVLLTLILMPGQPVYHSIADAFQQTWRSGGARALYRGLLPSLGKVVPANAISYWVYDHWTQRL